MTARSVVSIGWASLLLSACDSRRTLRTTIRSGDDPISESCVQRAVDATGVWHLRQGEGGLVILAKLPKRGSHSLSVEARRDSSVVVIGGATVSGASDDEQHLREYELEERDIAESIVRTCANHATIFCWESQRNIESERCFPW